MSNGIKIPVEAVFNAGGAKQGIDAITDAAGKADKAVGQVADSATKAEAAVGAMGDAIKTSGKQKLSPVEKDAVRNVRDLEAAVQSYFRVASAVGKRLKASGQSGKAFEDIDWHQMYPGDPARAQKVRSMALAFAAGHLQPVPAPTPSPGGAPAPSAPPSGPQPPPPPPKPTPWGKTMAGQVVGAGLNAAGPAGGVANGAIGAGVSGGLLAGVAGLVGGLAALAVGKAVGAVVEKVGAAQREEVGYDTLKRTLGDVNVGFNALKQSLQATSYSLDVSFDEGQRLAQQFARGSGMGGRAAGTAIAGEVGAAGGFARSFGLDPSQGAGFFAQQRMLGTTSDERGSRRLAMLIGEAISKSDAFSKADEVLDAIAGYTASQTRAGMNAANVEGYTAMLAGMVGSKRPGMDAVNSAALLDRANQSIIGGGAAGEAGQNFLFAALSRGAPGMDPIDAAVLQQQGAFGTRRKAFGEGSAYRGYMGGAGFRLSGGPDDDKTNLHAILEQVERVYGNSPAMKKLASNAVANLFNFNESQAMAMMSIQPARLGGMGNRLGRLGIDMKAVNASGISRMAQIEGDSSMSESQKDEAMRRAASEGQERTLGSDVRKSTTAVENIQQEIAGKLVPLTNEMRNGIMYLAGKGNMSTREIQEAVLRGDSKDRAATIGADFDAKLDGAYKDREKAKKAIREGLLLDGTARADLSPAEKQQRMEAAKARRAEEVRTEEVVDKLQKAKADALKDEADRLTAEITALNKAASERLKKEAEVKAERERLVAAGAAAGGLSGPASGAGRAGVALDADTAAYLAETDRLIGAPAGTSAAQIATESGWRGDAVSRRGARGLAQIMPATQAVLEKRLGRRLDPHNQSDALLMQRMVMQENVAKFGNWQDGARAYNGGWDRSRWGNRETSAYVPQIERQRALDAGTPLPENASASATGGQRHTVSGSAAVSVTLQYPNGQPAAPAQQIPVRLGPARPAGFVG